MNSVEFKFGLEDEVKDKITGYKGVVVYVTRWLNGCVRYGVKSRKLKDGKPMDLEAFDEQELELVSASKDKKTKRPGGPKDHPSAPWKDQK